MRRPLLSALILFMLGFFTFVSSFVPATAQRRPELVWMHSGSGGTPVYTPDGKYLVTSTYLSSTSGSLQIRRLSDGSLQRDIVIPDGAGNPLTIYTPAVSPDSQYIAAGCSDNSVRMWRITDGQQVLLFQSFNSQAMNTVAFSPNGTLLAGGSSDRGVYVWRVSSGSQVHDIHNLPGAVKQIAFTPNGQYLIASATGGAYIYNVSNWQPVSALLPGVAFDISPDSQTLALQLTGLFGGLFPIRLHNIPDGSLRGTIGSTDGGNGVRFSPDGRRIAQGIVGNTHDSIRIWNLSDGSAVSTINLSGSLPSIFSGFPGFAFAPDSQTLITFQPLSDATPKTMQEWRVSDGTATRTFTEQAGAIVSMAVSPDGKMLAECHTPSFIVVRRASDGAILRTLSIPSGSNGQVQFSPDGKYLAVPTSSGKVNLWRTDDWSQFSLQGVIRPQGPLFCLAFSPDGRYMAAGESKDETTGFFASIVFWHLPDFTQIGSVQTLHSVGSITFSPDGNMLASASI